MEECLEQSLDSSAKSIELTHINKKRVVKGRIPISNSKSGSNRQFNCGQELSPDRSSTCFPSSSTAPSPKSFRYKLPLCVCTCCHQTFVRSLCIKFLTDNYDYTNKNVSECLSDDIRYKHQGMDEFICKTCHKQLNRNNTKPVIPYKAVASPKKGIFSCLFMLL